MKNKLYLWTFCSIFSFFHSFCLGDEPPPGSTDYVRLSAFHTGGKGVGYKKPYSSLDLFVSPDFESCRPFLDVKGHVFNNARFAFNGGGGVRFFTGDRITGVNAYCDYRRTNHRHYSQIGLGLESLGVFWDARFNGYLAMGRRNSQWYTNNNSLDREVVLQGWNAEIAAHRGYECFEFYSAIGPYYLAGKSKHSFGGQARFQAIYQQFLSFEVIGTSDSLFGTIVQGRVGVYLPFPFGPFSFKTELKDVCCDNIFEMLKERVFQPVYRNEIIPVDKQHIPLIPL